MEDGGPRSSVLYRLIYRLVLQKALSVFLKKTNFRFYRYCFLGMNAMPMIHSYFDMFWTLCFPDISLKFRFICVPQPCKFVIAQDLLTTSHWELPTTSHRPLRGSLPTGYTHLKYFIRGATHYNLLSANPSFIRTRNKILRRCTTAG